MFFISFTGPNLPPYSYDKLTLAQKKTGSSEMQPLCCPELAEAACLKLTNIEITFYLNKRQKLNITVPRVLS